MRMQGQSYTNPLQTAVNRYLYNGKELQDDLGLMLYDYGRRQYDFQTLRFTSIDPRAEKYFSISPYAYVANNPIIFIDPNGDTLRVHGSKEFKAQYNKDLAELKKDKGFAKIIDYLDSHEKDINVTEAWSLIGAVKDLWEEGLGDEDHVKSSETKLTPEGVSLEYSQIAGAKADGIKSESSEVLVHEFTHTRDLLNGNIEKDWEAVRADKSIKSTDREHKVRNRMEKRAMQNANKLRKKRGKPIRKKYKGEQLIY